MTDCPDETRPGGIDWEDPSIPVGNAPTMPHWRLPVLVLIWLGWVAALFVMTFG